MAELKTQKNDGDVSAYIESVDDETKQEDCFELVEMLERLTGDPATMWGDSIIGFGEYSYQTRDGKKHTWFKVGFSPRKQDLTIYVMTGFDKYGEYLSKLGKHRTGVSCLYIKKLGDIDREALESLIGESLLAIHNRTTDTSLIL